MVPIRFGLFLPLLGEDSDSRPFRVIPRVAGGAFDFSGIDLVHAEDNLDVRESRESGECVGRKLRPVKFDMNLYPVPIVIFHLGPR